MALLLLGFADKVMIVVVVFDIYNVIFDEGVVPRFDISLHLDLGFICSILQSLSLSCTLKPLSS